MTEKHTVEYHTATDAKPFLLDCGHRAGTIHHDGNDAPYLLIHDDSGHTWHILGLARAFCRDKLVGEWHPGDRAMARMIASYAARDERLKALMDELKSLL